MRLFSYWRSGTSYRVRLALALKGAACEIVPVNLLKREHKSSAFLSINPQGLVPSLALDDGTFLSQSPAIIEYIDETLSGPKLFPDDPAKRAMVRQMAAVIGSDVHPLQNLRVLNYLRDHLGHDDGAVGEWAREWIGAGFAALEQLAVEAAPDGTYLSGEDVTAAECYLLPQLYGARRYGLDLTPYPRLLAVEDAVQALPAAKAAHPSAQPDAAE
ncbi:MAG: maleylacetoacetate isomerase [Pseudomonadota bacterium]